MPIDQDQIYKIATIDDDYGIVFGWAIVCKVKGVDYFDLNYDEVLKERVPENVPEAAMMKCTSEFMKTDRVGNDMHKGPDVGQYLFGFPLTTDIAKAMGITCEKSGFMVGFKPDNAEILEKYRNGDYTGFSIQGQRVSVTEVSDG